MKRRAAEGAELVRQQLARDACAASSGELRVALCACFEADGPAASDTCDDRERLIDRAAHHDVDGDPTERFATRLRGLFAGACDLRIRADPDEVPDANLR